MKARFFVSLGVALLFAGAQAQPTAPLDTAAERARIEAERLREETRIANEEALCYQRFAVNDCLKAVKVRRDIVLDDLRRQEIILNDIDRKKQAADQIRQIDEKSEAHISPEEAQRRKEAQQEYDEHMERAREKNATQNAVDHTAEPQKTSPAPTQQLTPEQRAEEKRIFEEKQIKAKERRAQRDKALADKAKAGPLAKPLPDPAR